MYAVPSDLTINGPMINVDAFKKAGVAVPTKWTWDQLVTDAKKVAAPTTCSTRSPSTSPATA